MAGGHYSITNQASKLRRELGAYGSDVGTTLICFFNLCFEESKLGSYLLVVDSCAHSRLSLLGRNGQMWD